MAKSRSTSVAATVHRDVRVKTEDDGEGEEVDVKVEVNDQTLLKE